MTINGLDRWLKPFSGSIRGSAQRGRRPRPAFRPLGEALEHRVVLSEVSWLGAAENPNWSDPHNWLHGTLPKAGDELVFPAGAEHVTSNNNLDPGIAYKSITIEAAPYTISGNSIIIQARGSIDVTASSGSAKLNLPMELTDGVSITTKDKVSLTISAGISGKGQVAKYGSGALVLSGAVPNTFDKGMTVFQGSVQLAKTGGAIAVPEHLDIRPLNPGFTPFVKLMNNDQIDKGGGVFVNAGSTLDLADKSQTITVLNLTGGKVIGTDKARLGLLGFSNNGKGAGGQMPSIDVPLVLGAGAHPFTMGDGGTLTINGPISGNTSTELSFAGNGTLNLAGTTSNTYAGTTLVKSGTLLLSKSGTKPEDMVAVPGALIIGNASRLPSVVRLGLKNQSLATASVTVNPSGLFDLNKLSTQIASLKMTGGTVSNGTLTLGGNVEATSVAGPKPDSPNETALISANLILGASSRTFLVKKGPADVDLRTTAAIAGSTDVALIKEGAGTLQFAGVAVNTYRGTTSVNEGRLQLNKSGPVNDTIPGRLVIGTDEEDAPAAVVQLLDSNEIKDDAPIIVNGTGVLDLNNHSDYIGALTLFSGQVKTGTGVLSLNRTLTAESNDSEEPSRISGKLNLGPAQGAYTREFKINRGLAPVDLIINGVISGPKGASLLKTGAGTVQFAGSTSNTYEGGTTVKEGLLELEKDVAKAIIGELRIGGETTSANPGKVRLLGHQELANNVNVSILPLGELDLNNKSQEIHNLTITLGQVTLGNEGVLSLLGNLTMTGGEITGGNKGYMSLASAAVAPAFDGTPAKITGRISTKKPELTFAVAGGAGVGLIADVTFLAVGTLEKTGSGFMVLPPGKTLPGLINLRAGGLRMAGSNGATNVHVYGGVLEGAGTTQSLATGSEGKMRVSIGTATTFGLLNATQGVNLTAGATLQFKINGAAAPAAGVNFDQLSTAAAVNLNGAILSVNAAGFQHPPKGTRYTIITNTSGAPVGGRFSNMPTNGSLMRVAVPNTTREVLFEIEYGVGVHKNGVDLIYRGEII